MRSKAHIKSHPIHPILIAFPITFFFGTLLFDVLGNLLDKPSFLDTAHYLNTAGVIAAIVTAIPGIIDFIYTVPPNSSAKDRAAKHGMINTTVLVLFTVTLLMRQNTDPSFLLIIIIEAVAVGLMMMAGWMGATLVHRNQIGVDIRYAHAGKWNELYVDEPTLKIHVGNKDDLQPNQMKLVHVEDKRIVVARTENGFVAFDDWCPHKGGSLAGGAMMCGTVQCPWHGSQFKVDTGEVTAGPSEAPIKTYEVSEEFGKLYLINAIK